MKKLSVIPILFVLAFSQSKSNQVLYTIETTSTKYYIIDSIELINNEAIKVYKKALSLEPNYVSFNNMGNVLKDQGKLDEAIDAYKNSISLKSDYAFAYNNMATALKKQDKLKDSLVFYNRAILLKPDFVSTYT